MGNISIWGSAGSIGKSTLDVIRIIYETLTVQTSINNPSLEDILDVDH